jgi:hypothetical protein
MDNNEIANELELIKENLEIVYNYAPDMLINWQEILMKNCRQISIMEKALRSSGCLWDSLSADEIAQPMGLSCSCPKCSPH